MHGYEMGRNISGLARVITVRHKNCRLIVLVDISSWCLAVFSTDLTVTTIIHACTCPRLCVPFAHIAWPAMLLLVDQVSSSSATAVSVPPGAPDM